MVFARAPGGFLPNHVFSCAATRARATEGLRLALALGLGGFWGECGRGMAQAGLGGRPIGREGALLIRTSMTADGQSHSPRARLSHNPRNPVNTIPESQSNPVKAGTTH